MTRNVFGSDMMDKLPNLGLVAVLGVGYDQVDLEAAKARGIAVTNTPDVLSEEVADYAMGLLLSLARRLPQGERYLRAGRWETEGPIAYSRRPRGKKVGVLGLGRIGAAFAILILIWKVGTLNVLRRFIEYGGAALRLKGVRPLKGTLDAQFKTSLFLAPSALIAVVLVKFELLSAMGLDIVF